MTNNATEQNNEVLPLHTRQFRELMTAKEAVKYLRLDIDGPKNPLKTLAYYRGRSLLKGTRVGKFLRYRIEDLKEFLKIMSDRTNGEE